MACIAIIRRGQHFARVRFYGKLYRRKLETGDLAGAKRKAHRCHEPQHEFRKKGWTTMPRCSIAKLEKRDGVESWFGIDSLRFPCYLPFKSQCTDAC
jgi:hypothetical protein